MHLLAFLKRQKTKGRKVTHLSKKDPSSREAVLSLKASQVKGTARERDGKGKERQGKGTQRDGKGKGKGRQGKGKGAPRDAKPTISCADPSLREAMLSLKASEAMLSLKRCEAVLSLKASQAYHLLRRLVFDPSPWFQRKQAKRVDPSCAFKESKPSYAFFESKPSYAFFESKPSYAFFESKPSPREARLAFFETMRVDSSSREAHQGVVSLKPSQAYHLLRETSRPLFLFSLKRRQACPLFCKRFLFSLSFKAKAPLTLSLTKVGF